MAERLARESHRLVDHDYTEPGSYFVTVCVHDRAAAFGEVATGKMEQSTLGVLVERELLLVPVRRAPWIQIAGHIVMPNHVHAIIVNARGDRLVHRKVRAGKGAQEARAVDQQFASAPMEAEFRPYQRVRPPAGDASVAATLETLSLGAIVGGFKAGVTREARRLGLWGAGALWQRDYYDHVIRSPEAFRRIRGYITNNPAKWGIDHENPDRLGDDPFETWLAEEGTKPLA